MKKFAVLLFAICSVTASHAQQFRDVTLEFGLSRSGLPAGATAMVHCLNEQGTNLGHGSVTISGAIEPGGYGRAQIRLPRNVALNQIRRVNVAISHNMGQTRLQFKQLNVIAGTAYPRIVLVQRQFVSTPYTGASQEFSVSQTRESELNFDAISFSGDIVDAVEIRNRVEFWLELTDGTIWTFPAGPLIRSRNGGEFDCFFSLPRTIKRNQIKRFRLYSGRSNTFRVTSFDQLFYETDDVKLKNVRLRGSLNSLQTGITDYREMNMENHKLFTSLDLSPGVSTVTPEFKANWFNVYLFTGNDDLRWDPNVQPNMEVMVNIYLRGLSAPIRIVSRSLNPYAAFANGGVFGGSFAGYDIAERIAPWRDDSRAPRIQDIVSVEVETVRGWDGNTPTKKIVRGSGDPFRQPDTWAFRGIWMGVSADLPQRSANEQALAPWTTLVCDFTKVHRMKEGDKVSFPVRITTAR